MKFWEKSTIHRNSSSHTAILISFTKCSGKHHYCTVYQHQMLEFYTKSSRFPFTSIKGSALLFDEYFRECYWIYVVFFFKFKQIIHCSSFTLSFIFKKKGGGGVMDAYVKHSRLFFRLSERPRSYDCPRELCWRIKKCFPSMNDFSAVIEVNTAHLIKRVVTVTILLEWYERSKNICFDV